MSTSSYHILVVDDNETNRKYVGSVFSEAAYMVTEAPDGITAISLLTSKKLKPHLILVDIQMPGMDGFECYTKFRNECGITCPILAITAFSTESDRARFIDHGFNDYITKPVKPSVLKGIVDYWIANSDDKPEAQKMDLVDFDESVLDELKRLTKEQDLKILYDQFFEELKSFCNQLAFLRSTDNYPEILSILHKVKGNAGSLGFAKLSNITESLEEEIKTGKVDGISERIEGMIIYSTKVLSNYENKLNRKL